MRCRVFEAFRSLLTHRLEEALRELSLLNEAAAAETKSSAGDKYETAREMIAQSRSLQEKGRSEAQAGLDWIERIQAVEPTGTIHAGTLVRSDLGWHLVGALTSAVLVDGMSIQGITLSSPLGIAIKGKAAGQAVDWRGRSVKILEIH